MARKRLKGKTDSRFAALTSMDTDDAGVTWPDEV